MTDHVTARNSQLELLEAHTRVQVQLTAPVPPDILAERYPKLVTRPDEFVALKYCQECTPPEVGHTCPLCDAGYAQLWQLQFHRKFPPEFCNRRRAKKERAWANRVGLDG